MAKAVKGLPAAYVPRLVDLTAFLPSEILLEICSHMRPITLWRMLFLNKRMYALLSSNSGLAIWHAAIEGVGDEYDILRSYSSELKAELDSLPLENGRPLNLIKVAGLLFRSDCQMCGKETSDVSFCLLLRICTGCQDNELVSLSDVRKDEAIEDLHPETLSLVKTVNSAPNQPYKKCPFALRSEIARVHQDLEDLQLIDDAKPRSVASATGSSRRGGGMRRTSAAVSSEATVGTVSSHVANYVRKRRKTRDEEDEVTQMMARLQITRWLMDHGGRGAVRPQIADEARDASEHAKMARQCCRQAIFTRIGADKPFDEVMTRLAVPDWHLHPDVYRSRPLASDEWQAIAPRIRAGFGRCLAYNILDHHGLKPTTKSFEKLGALRIRALEKPEHLDDAVWTYMHPQIDALIEEQKSQALADQVAREKRDAESQRLGKVRAKVTFFIALLDEILTAQPDKAAKAVLLVSSDFVHLPTVSALYNDPEFAIDEARHDADLATWSRHSEAIQEEVADYAVQVRLEALRTILSATTAMSADALDQIDADALLDSEYDDDFFARPSSWMTCSECAGYWAMDDYGPLQAVLEHRLERHSRLSMPTPAGLGREADAVAREGHAAPTAPTHAFVLPVKVPLEFACTVLSLCELGSLDPNDSTLSPNDLNELFEEAKLVWRNSPRSRTSRYTCHELVHQVIREAGAAEREGKVLPVPDVARRELKWRERIELNSARQRKAAADAAAAKARAKEASSDVLASSARGTGNDDTRESEDETLARDWMDARSDDELRLFDVAEMVEEDENDEGEDSSE